jgi:RNA methyltransferase, TrmH family
VSRPRPARVLVKIIGAEACSALFARRPDDITEVRVIDRVAADYAELRAFCAKARLPFSVTTLGELTKFTDSQRHDGICVLARPKRPLPWRSLLANVDQKRGPLSLVLAEELRNPNNLGAVLRVAGHFGAAAVLVSPEGCGLSMASMRTAEGAAEYIDVVEADPLAAARELKSHGVSVVATSSHATRRLGQGLLPKRALFLLGSENAGLSRALEAVADLVVAIPGAGSVESLNVACAASVILWEHWRSWRGAEATPPPPATSRPRSS